jgi:hypothetical protein
VHEDLFSTPDGYVPTGAFCDTSEPSLANYRVKGARTDPSSVRVADDPPEIQPSLPRVGREAN